MKNGFYVILVIFFLCITSVGSSYATPNAIEIKVPFNAEPNATYLCTEDGEMELLYIYVPKDISTRDTLLKSITNAQSKNYEEDSIFELVKEEARLLPTYSYEFDLVAYPGDEIIYDAKGEFLNIIRAASIKGNSILAETRASSISYGTVKKGTHYYPDSTKANKLVITDSSVTGTGYGTNFTYKSNGNSNLGQKNHTLVAGDCATNRNYDNAICGTIIGVRNFDNDIREDFEKWDIGSLTNAVIDIWWKGLPLLGINTNGWDESDYRNCRFSARYWYEF
ncbi:hypothetical protein [Tissierella praeacuta]|uniref:hypothetical protein n=1 Tax=Tissierella praeacuta TaxID=43131 RepID=UPI00333F5E11